MVVNESFGNLIRFVHSSPLPPAWTSIPISIAHLYEWLYNTTLLPYAAKEQPTNPVMGILIRIKSCEIFFLLGPPNEWPISFYFLRHCQELEQVSIPDS